MEVRFRHRVKYDTMLVWSLDDVISNLSAQKRLLEEGTAFLDHLIPGMQVNKVAILVNRVSAESPLFLDFFTLIYGAYQKQIEDKVINQVETMFGVDVPAEYEAIVTLGALAITYLVARWAYDKISARKNRSSPSVHIEGNYNTVINLIADKLEIPVSQVEDALQESLPPAKKRSLLKSVTKFLRPRTDGTSVPITIDGAPDVTKEVVDELPSDAELATLDESKNIDVVGARIDIRATDKDKTKSGWAAKIIGDRRFKRRLPMDLYPTVNAVELAKETEVTADIIVEGEHDASGVFRPKRIHILSYKVEK